MQVVLWAQLIPRLSVCASQMLHGIIIPPLIKHQSNSAAKIKPP